MKEYSKAWWKERLPKISVQEANKRIEELLLFFKKDYNEREATIYKINSITHFSSSDWIYDEIGTPGLCKTEGILVNNIEYMFVFYRPELFPNKSISEVNNLYHTTIKYKELYRYIQMWGMYPIFDRVLQDNGLVRYSTIEIKKEIEAYKLHKVE